MSARTDFLKALRAAGVSEQDARRLWNVAAAEGRREASIPRPASGIPFAPRKAQSERGRPPEYRLDTFLFDQGFAQSRPSTHLSGRQRGGVASGETRRLKAEYIAAGGTAAQWAEHERAIAPRTADVRSELRALLVISERAWRTGDRDTLYTAQVQSRKLSDRLHITRPGEGRPDVGAFGGGVRRGS